MMNEKISLKYIFKLLLQNKKALIIGQITTIIAILISVPIPLLLPLLVDEIILNKPSFFVNNINELIGNTTAFYYIAIVTLIVLSLLPLAINFPSGLIATETISSECPLIERIKSPVSIFQILILSS